MKKIKSFLLIILSFFYLTKIAYSVETDIYKKIDLFGEVLEKINQEYVLQLDDDIILSKAVEHEAGNYQYTFAMDYQNVDDKNNSNDALILWNILIDGKPYGHFVDSLMTPDLGWMKNNLWKNDKGLIFASQPQSLLLTLRGEHVLLDNQTPLKCVKGLDKIILDPMADPMATPDVSQIKIVLPLLTTKFKPNMISPNIFIVLNSNCTISLIVLVMLNGHSPTII